MHMRRQGAVFAIVAALGAQSAPAQPMNGCPAGHAIQASDSSGKNIDCIAVPAPVDVGGLQDAIDELRPANVVGTYAFTGTQLCLSSSLGFNPDFTPVAAPIVEPPPPPDPNLPPQPIPVVSAVVATSSGTVSGTRTFNADKTGTTQFHTHTVNAPGFFFNSFGNGLTTGGGINRPSGGASVTVSAGSFTWDVVDGKLVIIDDPAPGVIAKGGGIRAGWRVVSENLPPFVGILGKDLRNISVTHDTVAVEVLVLRSPEGQPFQEFRTPRVCHRERTLRRM